MLLDTPCIFFYISYHPCTLPHLSPHPMYIVKLKKGKHLQFMNYFLDG